jgi:hypothetical protein
MILYHFTRAKCLPSIEETGLLPGTDPEKSSPILTLGIPVVWLTSNKNPQWMRAYHRDAVVLTVDIKKRRLVHWRTWMEGLQVRYESGDISYGVDVLKVLYSLHDSGNWDAECFRECCGDFYVHLGPISCRRIKSVHPVEWATDDADTADRLEQHQARLEPAA